LTKRLDFENVLLHDIQRQRRKQPAVKLRWVAALFAVGAALAASASALFTLFGGGNHKAVAETASDFVLRIGANDMKAAVEFCPEGPLGAQLIAAEQARAFKPEAVSVPVVDPNAREERVAQLNRLRSDLENAGLDWAAAEATAFGGVAARVFDPTRMEGPATALVGNIYLTDGAGVYAIEVSLMNCLGSYVITDIWQWRPLDIAPETVEAHSRRQFDAFREETFAVSAEVDAPEHVFARP
jgi:hypothetical protein